MSLTLHTNPLLNKPPVNIFQQVDTSSKSNGAAKTDQLSSKIPPITNPNTVIPKEILKLDQTVKNLATANKQLGRLEKGEKKKAEADRLRAEAKRLVEQAKADVSAAHTLLTRDPGEPSEEDIRNAKHALFKSVSENIATLYGTYKQVTSAGQFAELADSVIQYSNQMHEVYTYFKNQIPLYEELMVIPQAHLDFLCRYGAADKARLEELYKPNEETTKFITAWKCAVERLSTIQKYLLDKGMSAEGVTKKIDEAVANNDPILSQQVFNDISNTLEFSKHQRELVLAGAQSVRDVRTLAFSTETINWDENLTKYNDFIRASIPRDKETLSCYHTFADKAKLVNNVLQRLVDTNPKNELSIVNPLVLTKHELWLQGKIQERRTALANKIKEELAEMKRVWEGTQIVKDTNGKLAQDGLFPELYFYGMQVLNQNMLSKSVVQNYIGVGTLKNVLGAMVTVGGKTDKKPEILSPFDVNYKLHNKGWKPESFVNEFVKAKAEKS